MLILVASLFIGVFFVFVLLRDNEYGLLRGKPEKLMREEKSKASIGKSLTYIAGDIMDRGAQLKRAEERDLLTQAGINVYTPQDNAEINDKQNAKQEGLAERIVREDVERLMLADNVVIETRAHAQGTLIELGQLHGMKLLARELERICFDTYDERHEDGVRLDAVLELIRSVLDKKVYPHDSDIRRHDNAEVGDRRSYAPNQYMFGVVLDLTDGHGYYEFEDAVQAIKESEAV